MASGRCSTLFGQISKATLDCIQLIRQLLMLVLHVAIQRAQGVQKCSDLPKRQQALSKKRTEQSEDVGRALRTDGLQLKGRALMDADTATALAHAEELMPPQSG